MLRLRQNLDPPRRSDLSDLRAFQRRMLHLAGPPILLRRRRPLSILQEERDSREIRIGGE